VQAGRPSALLRREALAAWEAAARQPCSRHQTQVIDDPFCIMFTLVFLLVGFLWLCGCAIYVVFVENRLHFTSPSVPRSVKGTVSLGTLNSF
jgi:hypothetical protein